MSSFVKWKRTKMNLRRSEWALEAAHAFSDCTGQDPNNELDEVIGDLLCDLMHLCKRNDVDFEQCLERGREHFKVEASGKEL